MAGLDIQHCLKTDKDIPAVNRHSGMTVAEALGVPEQFTGVAVECSGHGPAVGNDQSIAFDRQVALRG